MERWAAENATQLQEPVTPDNLAAKQTYTAHLEADLVARNKGN